MSEFYVVCDNGYDATKIGPLFTLHGALIHLNEIKNENPKFKYWVMESYKDDFGDMKIQTHEPYMFN